MEARKSGVRGPGLRIPLAWKDRTGNARRGDSFSSSPASPGGRFKERIVPSDMAPNAGSGNGRRGRQGTENDETDLPLVAPLRREAIDLPRDLSKIQTGGGS